MYEHELCILFADTNMGKSVLAVQIANSLATRRAIEPFELGVNEQTLVYLDFELSSQQFYARYTDDRTGATADFGKGFYRALFNMANVRPSHFQSDEDHIREAIEYAVMSTQADVLIIDNITCLKQGTENAGAALALMRMLKAIKAKLKISVLVLAHTPRSVTQRCPSPAMICRAAKC